jgi:hypothetical protein
MNEACVGSILNILLINVKNLRALRRNSWLVVKIQDLHGRRKARRR